MYIMVSREITNNHLLKLLLFILYLIIWLRLVGNITRALIG